MGAHPWSPGRCVGPREPWRADGLVVPQLANEACSGEALGEHHQDPKAGPLHAGAACMESLGAWPNGAHLRMSPSPPRRPTIDDVRPPWYTRYDIP